MGIEQGSPTPQERGISDFEQRMTQLTPDEQKEFDRIEAYNEESRRTGRKGPFGNIDLIPNPYHRQSLDDLRKAKEDADTENQRRGFGGGPVSESMTK